MSVQPSRREMLAAFLGLPTVLAAGCQREPARLPAGEIVGVSDARGHRLRDGWRPEPATDAWDRIGIVIVGGGIAGLAAAWRLLRAGCRDFVLLELETAPGGTSRSGQAATGGYPWGAHYFPAPLPGNRLLLTLLDEMGVLEGRTPDGFPRVAEQFLCRDPQERVYYRGRWYEGLYLHVGATSADEAERKSFQSEIDRWVAWRDGKDRRAFTIPRAHGSDDAVVTALDRQSMADWMDQHNFHSPRLRWLVDYACRDDYGCTTEQTSAWAGLFYFASRQRQPGSETQPLITWPEGNGRPVAHLFARVRDHVRLGWAVSEIVPAANGDRSGVDVIAVHGEDAAARGWHAGQVIFATPQFLTRPLLRPYRADPPPHLADFEYGAWLVANLHLAERPQERGFPLAWDNVLYESPSLGYVVNTHQQGRDHGPTVFTYYYPLCDADPRAARARLLSLSWAEWADVVLTDLTTAHADIRNRVERLDVMRWGHAMVRPRPGFLWGPALRAVQPYRGVYFAAADLSGLPLFEEAFYHGVRAAEEVLAARHIPSESLLGV